MSSERSESTKVWCPVCKTGVVHVELTNDLVVPPRDAIYGPGSRGQRPWRVTSIHCSSVTCGVLFHHVPGEPDEVEQILRRIMRKQTRTCSTENLTREVRKLLKGSKLPEVKRFIDENKKNKKKKKKKIVD